MSTQSVLNRDRVREGSLSVRWVVFIIVFFIGILSCFWVYTWNHREEFVQTAFSRLYPSYAVSIGSITLDTDGTVTMNDIQFFPKKESGQNHVRVAQIIAKASPISWLQWIFLPSTSPLRLSSLSIHGSTAALPPDVATSAEPFVQIDSLIIETRLIGSNPSLKGFVHEP